MIDIIEINKLNKTKGGRDFSYNDAAEDAIIHKLCSEYGLVDNGSTKGYDPRFDRIINASRVEIKIQSCASPFIEVSKFDCSKSGITETQSDIYFMVNPGNANGQQFMKGRFFFTADLFQWCEYMLSKQPDKLKVFEPNNLGPGSCGFHLDFNSMKSLNDLYVLGFGYCRDEDNKIIFDLNEVTVPQYAKSNIHQYIE